MKLGYELSAAQRAELEQQQIALGKLEKLHAAVLKKVVNLRAIETKVLASIAELEQTADGASEGPVTKLAGKRQQRELLRASIARGDAELGAHFLGLAQRAVNQAHGVIFRVTQPMFKLHLQEVVALLAPYCESHLQAELIVKSQVPSYGYLVGSIRENLGVVVNTLDIALGLLSEKLDTINRLLTGDDVFPDYAAVNAGRIAARAGRGKPAAPAPRFAPETFSAPASALTQEDSSTAAGAVRGNL